ncbi:MAG: hypothetical protein J7M34_07605 [Anaerolineae bacterium]|nr:hypothetical protein [Anaerolineae bacterium]
MPPIRHIWLWGSLIILLALSGAQDVHAATSTEPPIYPINFPYGSVAALTQDPTHPDELWAIIQVTTPQRRMTALYRTTDGGQSWQAAGNDLSWLQFTTLRITPSGTFLLGTNEGLYRRSGLNSVWTRVPLETSTSTPDTTAWPTHGMTIRQVLLPQAAPNRMYVIASENQKYPRHWLFRSQDGGQSFERFLIQEFGTGPGSGLGRVLVDPTNPETLYAATRGGVLTSTDGGESWMPGGLDPSLTEGMTALAAQPDKPNHLLAIRSVRDDRGIHLALAQSQDGGRTWSESVTPLPGGTRPLDLLATPDGELILATDLGVFIGSADGKSWQPADGDLSAMGAYQLLPDATQPDVIWAATPAGVYRCQVSSASCTPRSTGLPPTGQVQALFTTPEEPDTWLAAMGWDGAELSPPAIFRTTDGGQSWRGIPFPTHSRVTAFAQVPKPGGRLYAATGHGICWSDDLGRSWAGCTLSDHSVQQVAVGADGAIYAATYISGLYRSTDGGETWSPIGFESQNISAMLLRPDGLYVVVQGDEPGLYRTQDDGRNWQKLSWPGEPGVAITQLAGNRQTLIAAVDGQGLHISQDGGITWERAQGPPPNATFNTLWVDPRTPERVFAARKEAGLWVSHDGGLTWQLTGDTLGDNRGTVLAADYHTANGLLVATARAGLWANDRGERKQPPLEELDARIEIVWPHGGAPVAQATQANLSLRLFRPNSLEPIPCGWKGAVEVWEARDSEPAHLLAHALRRQLGDALTALWDVNDINVSHAQQPKGKLYFLARVPGIRTHTSMWAHASDPRTYYPEPPHPTAMATSMPKDTLDARILVVWPHDITGRPRPVQEADLANIRVGLYQPGTLIAIPPNPDLTVRLIGALDNGIGRTVGIGHMRIVSDGITYPVWEFDNVDVSAARSPHMHWAFWIEVEGYKTRSNVWVHGVDARTQFPLMDQPIVGCRP